MIIFQLVDTLITLIFTPFLWLLLAVTWIQGKITNYLARIITRQKTEITNLKKARKSLRARLKGYHDRAAIVTDQTDEVLDGNIPKGNYSYALGASDTAHPVRKM